jgi:hypothetical protein
MLPEVSVDLLGPITTVKGHDWPLGYDWVRDRADQPVSMTAVDRSHRLVIRLPSGRVLSHPSRATFFNERQGPVTDADLMPLDVNVRYLDAISYLEKVLAEWDVGPNERAKQAITRWKTYGDIAPDPVLVNYTGYGSIKGEERANVFLHVRPASQGWFLTVNVGATSTQMSGKDAAPLRQVEVPLLGKVSELKGMQWPDDPRGVWLSRGVSEPCDLTVHLPDGKALRMRTRPVLLVGRIMFTDVVGEVHAPPEGGRASLRAQALAIERLLAQWEITPDARLKAELDEWKQSNDSGTGIGAKLRIGMSLKHAIQLSFRATSGGPPEGGWFLVVEIEVTADERRRIREWELLENRRSRSPSTQPERP